VIVMDFALDDFGESKACQQGLTCSGGCKFPGSVAEIDGGRYGSVRAWDSFEQGMGGVRKDRLATMRSVVKAMGGGQRHGRSAIREMIGERGSVRML
jgi:hypothetical protein